MTMHAASGDELAEVEQRVALQEAFGTNLRALRLERGWSQVHLAVVAGVHFTYVGQIERGERNLTMANIVRLGLALEVPIGRLFAGIDPFVPASDVPPPPTGPDGEILRAPPPARRRGRWPGGANRPTVAGRPAIEDEAIADADETGPAAPGTVPDAPLP